MGAPDNVVTPALELEQHAHAGAGAVPFTRCSVFWLVLAAFLVRLTLMLLFATYLPNRPDDHSIVGEAPNVARSILQGQGFSSPFRNEYTGPTAWVAPAYPYFLAFVYRCFGVMTTASTAFIFLVQALLSALTVIPILGIAGRTVGERAGYWAAWTWILFPWFSKWSITWVWEVALSALLFTFLFWIALCLPETSNRKAWIGFGAICGFALLLNPALGALLPVSLAFCAFNLHARKKEWPKPVLTALLTCLVVISPWLLRNRVVFGRWVFLRGNFGVELALGNFHSSLGFAEGGTHPTFSPKEYADYMRMGEASYVHSKELLAFQFMRDYPWEFITLTGKRIVQFWDGSSMLYHTPIAWYWMPSSFVVLSFLLLPALLIAHRRNLPGWQLFFGALLLYPLPYYLTFSHVRYRHAVEPLILLLIAYSGVEVLNTLASSAGSRLMGSWRKLIRLET